MFAHFDRTKNGAFEYRELRDALRALGYDASHPVAANLIKQYDDTPDGKMQLTEFATLVNQLEQGFMRSALTPMKVAPSEPQTQASWTFCCCFTLRAAPCMHTHMPMHAPVPMCLPTGGSSRCGDDRQGAVLVHNWRSRSCRCQGAGKSIRLRRVEHTTTTKLPRRQCGSDPQMRMLRGRRGERLPQPAAGRRPNGLTERPQTGRGHHGRHHQHGRHHHRGRHWRTLPARLSGWRWVGR